MSPHYYLLITDLGERIVILARSTATFPFAFVKDPPDEKTFSVIPVLLRYRVDVDHLGLQCPTRTDGDRP
ncbi:hypothetical protein Pla22_19810 [Rubripirellula amarantea]|uniref:Uncharacterized protein n=1 Tax=Rubripirellula amarantea TaxID=2527999 RepID=A0A5C5WWL7_9BACT|nr:hypothetical protein Pla22_19810 [Rubripirellula amarantea]